MFLHMLYTVFYDIPTYMPVIPVISAIPVFSYTLKRGDDDVDDDDDESKSYVRPLLQLETVTGVLVIRSDKQFSFQITKERGCKMAAAYRCCKIIPGRRSCPGEAARTVSERRCG